MILFTILPYIFAQECTGDFQSPVDLYPPFTPLEQDIEWLFGYQSNAVMYSNGYSLKIDGDFGGFRIDNAYYWSTDISFKSPSEHTIRGARLPMEMQINFHTRDNLQAVVSVLFRESERDSVFLNSLGFGNPQLRNAQQGLLFYPPDSIDLEDFLGSPRNFLLYLGSTTSSPCVDDVVRVVLTDTFTISNNQLYNFPQSLLGNYRELQPLNNREVYVTAWTDQTAEGAQREQAQSMQLVDVISQGRTYKPVNDEAIRDPIDRSDEMPEVNNIYS